MSKETFLADKRLSDFHGASTPQPDGSYGFSPSTASDLGNQGQKTVPWTNLAAAKRTLKK